MTFLTDSFNSIVPEEEPEGYEKGNFMKNIAIIIVSIIAIFLAMMILLILYLLQERFPVIRKGYEALRNTLLFGTIFTYIIKSYLKLHINSSQGTQ